MEQIQIDLIGETRVSSRAGCEVKERGIEAVCQKREKEGTEEARTEEREVEIISSATSGLHRYMQRGRAELTQRRVSHFTLQERRSSSCSESSFRRPSPARRGRFRVDEKDEAEQKENCHKPTRPTSHLGFLGGKRGQEREGRGEEEEEGRWRWLRSSLPHRRWLSSLRAWNSVEDLVRSRSAAVYSMKMSFI